MELVLEEVESQIQQLVKKVSDYPVAWRAIHCLWTGAPQSALEELVSGADPILDSDESYLFQWGGDDIFILVKGTRKEPLEKARHFIENFARKKMRLRDDVPYDVKSYDLSIAWDEFKEFFKKRQQEILHQNKEPEVIHQSIRREEKEDVIRLIKSKAKEKKAALKKRIKRPGVTILAVDEDANTLSLIDGICKGYRVLRAASGEEALEKYFDEAPDIVIMDTHLPVIDGWEVVKNIYEMDDKAFVIMVTAHADQVAVQKAVQFGVKGFVKKPFSQAKVEQYLERFGQSAPVHKRVQV